MPEPVVNPDDKTTPTFDDNQQKFINEMFDKRFGKIQSKHADELKSATDKIAELTLALEEHKASKPGKKDGDPDDAKEKQFKELIKAEQSKYTDAQKVLGEKDKEINTLRSESLRIRKEQAIRDAASKQGFHEIVTVIKLTGDEVVWNDDHNAFVVMENGIVKNNASMQPMSLDEYYAAYAAQRPYLVSSDMRGGAGSKKNDTDSKGLGVINTKADFKSTKDKVAWVSKFGQDAFEALPLK